MSNLKYLVTFVVSLMAIHPCFADVSTTQDDTIQLLVLKLEARDLTIRELREANLDLVVINLSLTEANSFLRRELSSSRVKLLTLRKKYDSLVSNNKQLRHDLEKACMAAYQTDIKSNIAEVQQAVSKLSSKVDVLSKEFYKSTKEVSK